MKRPSLKIEDLVQEPYTSCPNCSRVAFGVHVWVGDHVYTKTCIKCGHEQRHNLPPIKKRVIYLDQNAISEMMKSIHSDTSERTRKRLDPFWLQLFNKLDRLQKLRLIVCPKSTYHTHESVVDDRSAALERMIDQLSGDVSFFDSVTIRRFQLHEGVHALLEGRQFNLQTIDSVSHGDQSKWGPSMMIRIVGTMPADLVADIISSRDEVADGISEVFKRWQCEKDQKFEDWYREETLGFGRGIATAVEQRLKRHLEIQSGGEWTLDDILPSSGQEMFSTIVEAHKYTGYSLTDAITKTWELLGTTKVDIVPFVWIGSMLWAAVARKAAAGQKRLPSRGMASDIRMVSDLLPYCDTMFVDNEVSALLKESPLDRISETFNTEVFSLNNQEEFIRYLDEIESSASEEHLVLVEEVYGTREPKPYRSMYE